MEIWFRGFSLLDFKADDFPIQVTLKKLRDAEFFQEICSWISVSCKRRSVIALTVSFCCLRCCVPLVGFYKLDIDVLGIQRWFFFHYKYSLPLCFPGNAFSLYNYKY
jgi:hypothetical protein